MLPLPIGSSSAYTATRTKLTTGRISYYTEMKVVTINSETFPMCNLNPMICVLCGADITIR